MKRRLLFLTAVFCTTLLFMVLQKPLFMLFYLQQAAAASASEWMQVVAHGLKLDLTVAGYVTALPLLCVLVSLWLPLCEKVWRWFFRGYFVLVSLFAAAVFAVDLALYGYWGFRIDSTILIYLSDPSGAVASVGMWEAVRQVLIFVLYAGGMIFCYEYVMRLFSTTRIRWRVAAMGVLLLLGGALFVAIRGGVSVATANVSKVYFSANMFLNHAATNPLFSLISTLGGQEDYASLYPFFVESERAERFATLHGNGMPPSRDSVSVLRTRRPNVVLILLEGFGRAVMDAQVDGQPVMPYMQRFKSEGVWFENFIANSFRTDRGEVAVMSGFPAQTRMSIMKLPAKSRSLPSLARSLAGEGYATHFWYGGDLNFTNQASYMYATGWQHLFWQRDMAFDVPTSKWGYADDVVGEAFADEVLRLSATGQPFLAGWLTLSSHEPYDVPFSKFADPMFNSMAFTDHCVGRMLDRWRDSPAWDNMLVILVADHANIYPADVGYNTVQRHRIPMLWMGGALDGVRTVTDYASQIDIAATLLSQMGIDHSDFAYSKDIFDASLPKFGYYTFNDGFGVIDASGAVIYDCTADHVLEGDNQQLLDTGRTLLQTTYTDIGSR